MYVKKYVKRNFSDKYAFLSLATSVLVTYNVIMKKYIPSEIEPKWQKKWEESNIYKIDLSDSKNKFYLTVEFTYTSGDLHIGHWFAFAVPDIFARFKKMQGFKVFFPNGVDAFGLPAENAAIKQGIHPRDATLSNTARMKDQFKLMGASYNWDYEVITCDPDYYKWNQWIFLKLLEKGLAYRGKMLSNWCPSCQTVLANENVERGKCWRCDSEVIQKQIEQWFFKITDYADRLIWTNPPQVDWPKSVREAQNVWIGKSEGVSLKFQSDDGRTAVEVFTTAIDTVFGVTFLVLSPENSLLTSFVKKEQKQAIDEYVEVAKDKSELERKENKEKTGVFTGGFVINPFNNEKIPVWVADYVLAGYGTGAVMGVPGHDARDHEFAKKFGLEIKAVIKPKEDSNGVVVGEDGFWDYPDIKNTFAEKSVLFDSGEYDGLTSKEAKKNMSNYIENNNLGKKQVQYHLHDWSISRQRYWGTPIPIIYCDKCGIVPIPENDLPVELPYKIDFTPTGKPPLASVKDWVEVSCPKCGGNAHREVETMDTFVDSAWYFLRYLDPKNNNQIFNKDVAKEWMPMDLYFGGAEHTLGHTLYSRFIVKFLKDIGWVNIEEYALKRVQHGVILGPDGARMSKSHGNVINPDEQVKEYGADAVRLYLGFIGPYNIVAPWNPGGMNGVYHFLQRVWKLQEKIDSGSESEITNDNLRIMHKTIKKVTEDIENIKFNTAIAALMEWLNYLGKKGKVSGEEYKIFLLLLAPFAPHITEELWSILNLEYSIHQQSWPEFDNKFLEDQEVTLVVQVNSKVRETLLIQKDLIKDEKVLENLALNSEKVKRFLDGKSLKKSVYIPGKLINLVISS